MNSRAGEETQPSARTAADALAVQQLMHAHSERLGKYIERHLPADLRRLIDPQDVLQDALFEAFKHFDEFVPRDPDSTLKWLMTIARNRMVFLLRQHHAAKRDGRRLAGDELRSGSVVLLLQDLAIYRRTPSRSAAFHELMAAMEQLLQSLSPDQREAVRLRYIEGLSIKEVSVKLSRSEGAVQMLALRGLGRLREGLRSVSRFVW